MRAAIVENGIVTNVITINPDDHPQIDGLIVPTGGTLFEIGWPYANGAFAAPILEHAILPPAELTARIGAECSRRIWAVASATKQQKLSMKQTRMTPEQMVNYNAFLDWLDATVAVCRSLISTGNQMFYSDEHWPVCPDAVPAFLKAI